MPVILSRSSGGALDTNAPIGTYHITQHGSDWLFAVGALYTFAMLCVSAHAYVARNQERVFHYLFTISLFTGAIAYFTMASDLGNVAIIVADTLSSPGTRQIFYAKYINWFVGWTPLVIAVSIISGVSWATIVYNVALTWIWVVSLLASAFVSTNYKWGFFAFGTTAYFLLSASLLHYGIISAKRVGIKTHYCIISSYLVFLFLLYGVAYGLSDGGNKIEVTSGFIFTGILDVLTAPCLATVFVFLSRQWDYAKMYLSFTQYGRVSVSEPFREREKAAEPAGSESAATGSVAATDSQEVV
jgi:bacteriorhodopsin